jgi:magnesium-transporting ATPase (P-type)
MERRMVKKEKSQVSKNFTQERRYAGGVSQHIFSAILILLSALALFAITSMESLANVFLNMLVISILFLATILIIRIIVFVKDSKRVLASDALKSPSAGGRNLLKGVGLSLMLALALFLPFVLTYFIDMQTWIAMVLGAIAGYGFSDLSFAIYVRNWEKRNRIRLFRYNVCVITAENKSLIVEVGILGRKT